MAEAATVDDCQRFHQEVCKRIDGVDAKLDRVVDAEVRQAASLERTQTHLEGAAKELEQAARTINANSQWQAWAQGELTGHRTTSTEQVTETRLSLSAENKRLITILGIIALGLAGLKAGGLL